jgi:hypothetical protein
MTQVRRRNRLVYAAACLATVGIGLASRKIPGLFPDILGKYPGDALWTLMVLFGLGAVMPTVSKWRLAACALGISYLDEFSQIYQAPWINGIRSTTIGHLIFGTVFGWGDMAAYTAGGAVGAIVDRLLLKAGRSGM